MNLSEALSEAVLGARVRHPTMQPGSFIDYAFNGWRINFPSGSQSGWRATCEEPVDGWVIQPVGTPARSSWGQPGYCGQCGCEIIGHALLGSICGCTPHEQIEMLQFPGSNVGGAMVQRIGRAARLTYEDGLAKIVDWNVPTDEQLGPVIDPISGQPIVAPIPTPEWQPPNTPAKPDVAPSPPWGSEMVKYRDYEIYRESGFAGYDWSYIHKDFDGEEDNRSGRAKSFLDCILEIDELWDD